MKAATLIPYSFALLLLIACKDPCAEGGCAQEMTPPNETAFWGEIFPAIGAGCYYQNGLILLFNLQGDQYALVDPESGQYDGPLEIKDAILEGLPFDAVGAVQHHRDGRLIFFNKAGTQAADYAIDQEQFQPPIDLDKFGNDLHPFASSGVGAAAKSSFHDAFHFNQKGDEFTTYQSNTRPDYQSILPVNTFDDGNLSIDNVGAAIYLILEDKSVVLFDKTGTTYYIHNLETAETEGFFKL
ncbi:MAG: hypothetical protein AAFQ87_10280 [Bacteroidota bacterium]